jgi:uncharacterized protein YraI
MSLTKTLAAGAVALGFVAASASGAFAYSIAWADQNASVKSAPHSYSPTVNWIHNGQKLTVLSCSANWCKVKIPGQDGYVKKTALNFGWNGNGGWNGGWNGNGNWNGGWNNNGGYWSDHNVHGQACVSGPHGYFCIGG